MNKCLKQLVFSQSFVKYKFSNAININLFYNRNLIIKNYSWKSKLSNLFGKKEDKVENMQVNEESAEKTDDYVSEIELEQVKKKSTSQVQEDLFLIKGDRYDVGATTSQKLTFLLKIDNNEKIDKIYNSLNFEEDVSPIVEEIRNLGFNNEWLERLFFSK
jgi:hypothetical protein